MYNIGVLTINIEFMWRGLASISIRFVPTGDGTANPSVALSLF